MYMIDYLNAVFPQWGVFETEDAAWYWIGRFNPDLPAHYFKVFEIGVNNGEYQTVECTAPNRKYAVQK